MNPNDTNYILQYKQDFIAQFVWSNFILKYACALFFGTDVVVSCDRLNSVSILCLDAPTS
jgi:hypothetical protein